MANRRPSRIGTLLVNYTSLQEFLNRNLLCRNVLEISGKYDDQTKEAVRELKDALRGTHEDVGTPNEELDIHTLRYLESRGFTGWTVHYADEFPGEDFPEPPSYPTRSSYSLNTQELKLGTVRSLIRKEAGNG